MLVSVAVLGTLVGVAFLGFYYPDFRAWSNLNPFFHGIVLIGSIDNYAICPVGRLSCAKFTTRTSVRWATSNSRRLSLGRAYDANPLIVGASWERKSSWLK